MDDQEVSRFVDALQRAKTDDEQFAALLVIAEVAKKSKLTLEQRRNVFESIDFTFIKRLLNTSKDPEGCASGTLMSVGLTILLCMLRDTGLPSKPGILEATFTLLRLTDRTHLVYKEKIVDQSILKELTDDSLSCLQEITNSETGCTSVLENNGLKALYIEMSESELISQKTIGVLFNLLMNASTEMLANEKATVVEIIEILTERFCESQDCNKFDLLDWLTRIVTICQQNSLFALKESRYFGKKQETFLKKMRQGLMDVLQSKLKKEIKQTAIKLISHLVDVYGVHWVFNSGDQKFPLVVATVSSIEISMCLDKDNFDTDTLSSAFVITEQCIGYISKTDLQQSFDEDFASKFFRIISEITRTVILYFKQIMDAIDLSLAYKDVKTIACFRILCAWMCEETMALQNELIEIEPFLLKLAKSSFDKRSVSEHSETVQNMTAPAIFKFLLPVLCHWSSEENFRKIILQEQIELTLYLFADKLFENENSQEQELLETILGIFLNIVVTERELASQGGSVFADVLHLLMKNLEDYLTKCKSATLIANMVTLSLMLARLQYKELLSKNEEEVHKLFLSCADFFYDSCPLPGKFNRSSRWQIEMFQDIEELWLIGMDNLIVCLPLFPKLSAILKASDSVVKMKQIKGKGKSAFPKEYFNEFAAIEELFNKLQ